VPVKSDGLLGTAQPRALPCLATLRLLFLGILALTLFLNASLASGQAFQLGGGSSSLFQASGGSVEIHAPNYDGWMGLGALDGQVRLGAFLSTQWQGYTFGAGDHSIPLQFPTDIFDNSHYFLGRGASLTATEGRVRVFAFAGATSTGFISPFFRGASPQDGVGVLSLDMKLTPKLRAFSRNIFSNRQTLISGLEWQPWTWARTGLSAGMGANQGYLASSLAADWQWISLKAGYIFAGDQFRRIVVQTPLNSETDRENILVTVRPKSFFDLSAGRFNFLQPVGVTTGNLRATLDQYIVSARAMKFTLTGSLFQSQVLGINTHGTSFSLGRDFAHRVQATSYVFNSRSGNAPSTTSLANLLREVISPRLSLLQVVNTTNGQTSVSYGGEFLSNPVAFGVDYQTVYSPFRSGDPFHQVVLLHLRLQPFGSFQVNGATYVAPDGSVKYTTYGNTTFYRGEAGPGAMPNFKLPKYIFSGHVLDEQGHPIAGAALRIGTDLVFSNSGGEFFLRKKKNRPCRLEIELDQFLVPGVFAVVSSPTIVAPSAQGSENSITIILRRRAPNR
jgi:hypothetical protein